MAIFKKVPGRPPGDDKPKKPCKTCGGSGRYKVPHPSGDPKKTKVTDCPFCKGTGEQR